MEVIAFIIYRREDSAAEAKLIADALRRVIPSESVFMDTETIRSGEAWPDRTRAALSASRYVFVVMGPEWLTAGMNEWGQRKIDSDVDWVRLEIAGALEEPRKTVIPLLIRGAKMPPDHALPSDVAAVAARQAIEIRRDYWDHDVALVTARVSPAKGREVPPSPLVNPFWSDLSPDLQDAIALAATATRRAGKKVVSTRTLFAALRRLHPEPLREFFDKVPPGALPEALPEGLPIDADSLADIESFSSCVQDSLAHLTLRSSPERKLSAEDVVVDIARHGTGDSVRRLRTHGVDVRRVDEIVRQLGWRITERAAG
jgi:hypothetical protein